MIPIKVCEPDILEAMKTELEVATTKLMIPGENPPYFVSYLLQNRHHFEVWARYGSIYGQKQNQGLICYAQVRVGDYSLDQSIDGGLNNFRAEESDFWADNHPINGDKDVLRYSLRLLTEDKYREALEGYYKKKSYLVGGGTYSREIPNFSPGEPHHYREEEKTFDPHLKYWADLIVPLSERYRRYPHLRSSYVELSGERVRSYYQNTEGSNVITDQVFLTLELHALAIDKKGVLIKRARIFHFLSEDKAPDMNALENALEELAKEVGDLCEAPIIKPHHGPVLLKPMASGLFFHEVLGHRLEGERLLSEGEGQTLKGKIGERIIPEFLSVYDDPTQKEFKGTPLLGHYTHDSEGVPSERVELVKNGVLKTFLCSRTPLNKESRSNGHGRGELTHPPMTRMGNLMVETENGKDPKEMEELLIEKARELNKPFGLIIDTAAAGETDTSSYDFQAFKGEPERIFRVDAKTGKKKLVRGLDFIGTPLSAVNKIIAAGKDVDVFNSWCTAESGDVRVSSVAPSLLFSDMELQRSGEKKGPKAILPTYWADLVKN